TILSIIFLCGIALGRINNLENGPAFSINSSCRDPTTRREWRTLSEGDRLKYIEAVQCLRTLPSRLGLDQSLYDDFPYVHSRFGNYCMFPTFGLCSLSQLNKVELAHNTDDFLVWHRYFIHIYETALRGQCEYSGHLAYWDWSLDWENIAKSPVWDSAYGFGGNGNISSSKSVAYGHCVTDGAFAYLTALYFGEQNKKQCLSRGFITEGEARKKGFYNSPDVIKEMLRISEYRLFSSTLETNAHNSIPLIVRGDFYKVTAPYGKSFCS
ncbi:Tyrosinase ustQ, partial [Lachnellula suecica]